MKFEFLKTNWAVLLTPTILIVTALINPVLGSLLFFVLFTMWAVMMLKR